jgi:hypothetical protein
MAIRLRDYIYLDDDLVERLLSQVEGGVSSEEEHTDVEKIDKRRGAGVKAAPARAEIGRTTGKEISASRTVRQTADSACSRLIDSLEQSESLQFLNAFDDEIWGQLRRGEALEVESSIELSAIAQLGGIAEAFEPIAAVMSSVGQPVDVEGLETIKGFSKLSGLMKTIPILARPSGSPEYTFIASLKREGLRLDQDQLNGEATVFGTLQRRLRQVYLRCDGTCGTSARAPQRDGAESQHRGYIRAGRDGCEASSSAPQSDCDLPVNRV